MKKNFLRTTCLFLAGAAGVLAVSVGAADFMRSIAVASPPGRRGLRAPAVVQQVVERACRDCHSDETRWPWYARVAPISWMVMRDVEQGRRFLNFSRWQEYPAPRKMAYLAAIAGAASNQAMPPRLYRIAHRDARLTTEERRLIAAWARLEYRRVRQPETSSGE